MSSVLKERSAIGVVSRMTRPSEGPGERRRGPYNGLMNIPDAVRTLERELGEIF